MCESSKSTPWREQEEAYRSLGSTLYSLGKREEGQHYSEKAESFYKTSFAADQLVADKKYLKSLLAQYDAFLKQPGSAYPCYQGRSIARWYIVHTQFDLAHPFCAKVVEFCQDPKNYFDAGAEWDKRRRKGKPTEGQETITVGGKKQKVNYVDNRRPSGKLDRSSLVRSLVALSEVDEKLGKTEEAAQAMDEANKTYSKYQYENPGKLFQSFDAFVTESQQGTSVGQSKIDALLSW